MNNCLCFPEGELHRFPCPCHCHRVGDNPDVDSMMQVAEREAGLTSVPYGGAPGEIQEEEDEDEEV